MDFLQLGPPLPALENACCLRNGLVGDCPFPRPRNIQATQPQAARTAGKCGPFCLRLCVVELSQVLSLLERHRAPTPTLPIPLTPPQGTRATNLTTDRGHKPIISTFGGLRQENCSKFKANPDYGVRLSRAFTGCSSRRLQFDSQPLHGGSQLPVTPVPGIQYPLLASVSTRGKQQQADMQTKHLYT